MPNFPFRGANPGSLRPLTPGRPGLGTAAAQPPRAPVVLPGAAAAGFNQQNTALPPLPAQASANAFAARGAVPGAARNPGLGFGQTAQPPQVSPQRAQLAALLGGQQQRRPF